MEQANQRNAMKSKITPAEYFANRVYKHAIGEFTPMRSYERFTSVIKHFNKYIRKHLQRQEPLFRGGDVTTYIQFIYECPSGLPTKKQQQAYIYQWGEHGVNDLLDREYGCFITPSMYLSGDMIMLSIAVEWYNDI